MTRQLVGCVTLWISVFLPQPVASQAQDLSAFLPSEELTREFMKRSADTKAALSYNATAIIWKFTIDSPSDKLVYSRSVDGIGNPTRSILRTAPGGAMDPTIARPIEVTNLTIFVHQRGSAYRRQDESQPGTIATIAKLSSFQDLVPFIGLGAEIRFSSGDWVELGGKKYRNGGFRITESEFVFLSGTEFLGPDGSAIVIIK